MSMSSSLARSMGSGRGWPACRLARLVPPPAAAAAPDRGEWLVLVAAGAGRFCLPLDLERPRLVATAAAAVSSSMSSSSSSSSAADDGDVRPPREGIMASFGSSTSYQRALRCMSKQLPHPFAGRLPLCLL
jgi:hypothetical protein